MKLAHVLGFALGFAPIFPALANSNNNSSVLDLLKAVEGTGTQIVINGTECLDHTLFGKYTYLRDKIDTLSLCVANHNGDDDELLDTILHESVHVAQACKGGLLFPRDTIARFATSEQLKAVDAYKTPQQPRELEARVIAADKDASFVKNLITQHCK